MITLGSPVQGPLLEDLTRVNAPSLPAGLLIRCNWCGCSVPVDHKPRDFDCRMLQDERAFKYRT